MEQHRLLVPEEKGKKLPSCQLCHHKDMYITPQCKSPKNPLTNFDVISGRLERKYFYCIDARKEPDACGLEGKWFETRKSHSLVEIKASTDKRKLGLDDI